MCWPPYWLTYSASDLEAAFRLFQPTVCLKRRICTDTSSAHLCVFWILEIHRELALCQWFYGECLSSCPVISHEQQSLDWPWQILRPWATGIHYKHTPNTGRNTDRWGLNIDNPRSPKYPEYNRKEMKIILRLVRFRKRWIPTYGPDSGGGWCRLDSCGFVRPKLWQGFEECLLLCVAGTQMKADQGGKGKGINHFLPR